MLTNGPRPAPRRTSACRARRRGRPAGAAARRCGRRRRRRPGDTDEQTRTRSVPSCSITSNLRSARRRLASTGLRADAVEVPERLVEVDRQAQIVAARADLGGRPRRDHEVGFEDLHTVEAGVRRRGELVLQRAGDADGGDRGPHPVGAGGAPTGGLRVAPTSSTVGSAGLDSADTDMHRPPAWVGRASEPPILPARRTRRDRGSDQREVRRRDWHARRRRGWTTWPPNCHRRLPEVAERAASVLAPGVRPVRGRRLGRASARR